MLLLLPQLPLLPWPPLPPKPIVLRVRKMQEVGQHAHICLSCDLVSAALDRVLGVISSTCRGGSCLSNGSAGELANAA
jgi:hypothetical protein